MEISLLSRTCCLKVACDICGVQQGGNGIHLHYIYDGDATRLSSIFEPGIEVKVFNGNASLRRKLSKCNNVPVATINSGLNLKGEKVINFEAVRSENVLREMIKKNLRKEYHPATKPSIDFIYKILEDAYNSGLRYDVTDLRGKVLNFAMDSTNQAENCVSIVSKMKFISDHAEEESVVQTVEGLSLKRTLLYFSMLRCFRICFS